MATTATFRTTLGVKTWEISRVKVVDIDSLSTGFELEAEDNDAVEGSPLTNVRGLKKKQISFSSNINAACGFDVKAEFESWESWVGLAGLLRFGGERFGQNSWLLNSVKATGTVVDPSGRWRSTKLAFVFEESDDSTVADIEEAEAAIQASGSAARLTATEAFKASKKPKNPWLSVMYKAQTGNATVVSLGDTIWFTGGAYYTASTGDAQIGNAAAGYAKVTKMALTAKHPYFVIHADGGSTVAGWVDASQVTL